MKELTVLFGDKEEILIETPTKLPETVQEFNYEHVDLIRKQGGSVARIELVSNYIFKI